MAIKTKEMKRFIYMISCIAASMMVAASCEKVKIETSGIDHAVAGVWELTEASAEGKPVDQYEVYLHLAPEGTFELYQKSGSQTRYDLFTGTFTTGGGIIAGVYSDGKPWGAKYNYTISGETLTLKSFNLLEERLKQRILVLP